VTRAAAEPFRDVENEDPEAPAAPSARAGGGDAPAGSPQQRVLDERYGRGRRRRFDRRLGWGAAAVLLLAGLAVLLFSGWQNANTIEFRDLAYSVVDDRTVEIDFEVSAPPGTEVVCALEALSESYAQLGWRVHELPASEQRTRRFSDTLVTTGPATTGVVKSCWVR
jgi:hypothetical protein